jgi:hypothetical protein
MLPMNILPPSSGSKSKSKPSKKPAGSTWQPEGEGSTFLWNVGLLPDYMALHSKRKYSSQSALRSSNPAYESSVGLTFHSANFPLLLNSIAMYCIQVVIML